MYRCYEYGCREPESGMDAVIAQMKMRNWLWNQFVEIEHKTSAARNVILEVPAQAELEQRYEDLRSLRKEYAATKKKLPVARTRRDADPLEELGNKIKDLQAKISRSAKLAGFMADGKLTELENQRAAIKHLWVKIKADRKSRAEEKREELKAIEQSRRDAVADAIRQSAKDGLYWENSGDVRTHYEGHRVAAMKKGAELNFHRWDGAGKICVRWQKGTTVASILAGDSLLAIDPVDQQAFDSPVRSERRKLCRTKASIRTYDAEKNLIAIPFQLFMHRPIPQNAIVRTAGLVRERVADSFRYKLIIAVDEASPAARSGHEVTVVFGSGGNIATWHGSDGRQGVVSLPERLIGNFRETNGLQAIIDQKFNTAKELLSAFVSSLPRSPGKRRDDWLKEEAKTPFAFVLTQAKANARILSQWRSPGRMRWLVDHWQPFKGDEMIVAALKEWRIKHMHLWLWKRNLEDQMVRARREQYRMLAAKLAREYATLRIPNEDLAVKKLTPPVESEKVVIGARIRDIAARGVLRGVLINAFTLSGGTVIKEEAQKFAYRAAS